MKITSKQFAQILYEITDKKDNQAIKKSIHNFVKELQKNHQLKLKNDLIRNFEIIWNKNNKIAQAKLITARPLSSEVINKIKKFIKKKYQANKVILKHTVNPSIKGGFIIKTDEEIIDASISKKIKQLNKAIRNS